MWHRWHRPQVATLEVHGRLAFPGGHSAVIVFELSVTRPRSDDGRSDGGSLPSSHSVFGSVEEVDTEEEGDPEHDAGEEEPEAVAADSEPEEVG